MAPETEDLIDDIAAHHADAQRLLRLVEERLREAEALDRKLAAEQRDERDEVDDAVNTLRRAGLLPA